ncbi:MAG: ABC transporter permease subunit [Solirubrobacterales bacterium]
MKRSDLVPLLFLLLAAPALYFSEMSPSFVADELLTRFIRDSLLVLALVIPVAAGMGLNFAVTIGAMAAQIGILAAIILRVNGMAGWSLALVVGLVFSIFFGILLGHLLNRVKGREMIATIVIGLLANGIYQFFFLAGYGRFIPALNKEILLSRGTGIRNMVDLDGYRNILDGLLQMKIGDITLPVLMVVLVICACAAVAYVMETPLGQRIRAVGLNRYRAALLGIDVDRTRIIAMTLSTVIACLGQLIFLENIGMLNVYTAHRNHEIFAAASLLAGGATVRRASVRNVILGVFAFHALFIVSPQAGQNLFGNAALGEYFRSFVAYGTIAAAILLGNQAYRHPISKP